MKTPAFLKKGDLIALVAPAGPIENEKPVQMAEDLIASWGLVSVKSENLLKTNNYLSGTDKERLVDLQKALDNPKIKAIWAIRGGYGSMRILDKLDFTKFINKPKWIIGFSDITALHNKIHQLGIKSLHAMMPIQLLDDKAKPEAINSLRDSLFGKPLEIVIPASKNNKTGSAVGTLVGGNLSIIKSLVGTPFYLNTKDKILFLEEVGEPLYKIDRLLTGLKLSGHLKNLQAMAIGSFTDIEPDKPDDKKFQKLVLDIVKDYDFPVIFDVPSGHIPENHCLILGEQITINVGEFVSCIRSV